MPITTWLQIDKDEIKKGLGVLDAMKPFPSTGNIKNHGIIKVAKPNNKPSNQLASKIKK